MRATSIALKIALIAMCAALYAVLGYATYLGLFTPIIGVVRFWPPVFVPAVFSVAFGPMIGGLGAAIGIFISDMLIHGNALLSLIAGVPANFLCFFISGLKVKRKIVHSIVPFLGTNLVVVSLCIIGSSLNTVPWSLSMIYIGATIFSLAIALASLIKVRKWAWFYGMASLGLLIGASWIGITVWLFSQFFVLPTGEQYLPFIVSLAWMLWVYCTEIPFLLLIAPPIAEALERAGLSFAKEES